MGVFMKALFLTSSLGGYTRTIKGEEVVEKIVKCDNSNGFIDRLKIVKPVAKTFIFIASDPDGYVNTDKYANNIVKALNLDGFNIKNLIVIDHRFEGDISKTIKKADIVFLSGGNVPSQNKYFKEIGLKEIIADYDGVVIAQSAGSMNCSEVVYAQPELDEEFEDENFKKGLQGLGLIDFSIMPHMNSANDLDGSGHPTVMQMCLQDSYDFPHLGIVDYGFVEVLNGEITAYGKTMIIKDGECKIICNDGEKIKLNCSFFEEKQIEKQKAK